jgi:hypothetical protein
MRLATWPRVSHPEHAPRRSCVRRDGNPCRCRRRATADADSPPFSGEWNPAAVSSAAMTSSVCPPRARLVSSPTSSPRFDSSAYVSTGTGVSTVVVSPPTHTIRTRTRSGTGRCSTTFSTSVRSIAFFRAFDTRPSAHSSGSDSRMSLTRRRSSASSGPAAAGGACRAASSSAAVTARRALSHRRSSSAATSRFSGSTARYCRSASRASYRSRSSCRERARSNCRRCSARAFTAVSYRSSSAGSRASQNARTTASSALPIGTRWHSFSWWLSL